LSFLSGLVEKEFDVPAQVRDALGGDRRILVGFRQDERALDHRLSVKREALRGPSRIGGIKFFGLLDVLGYIGGVAENAAVAGALDSSFFRRVYYMVPTGWYVYKVDV
jgi:hypothetical protein